VSSNPLEDDPKREHRIRDRAYHLWNDQGRPHGRHDEFWERARELVGMEESAGFGQLPNPETAGDDPSRSQPVEEAFLQENLGEFPDRLSDQGEVLPTPRAGRTARSRTVAPEPPSAEAAAKTADKRPETLPAKPSLKEKAANAPAKGKAPKHKS